MHSKLLILYVVIFAIALAALIYARSPSRGPQSEERITVLSTFTVIADMVREVGGDRVEAISLTKPGVEIHGYEPTPGDLVRASSADIIFDNGLNLEVWAQKLYVSLSGLPHVTISDGVEIIPIREGLYKDRPNPHAWMSPKQALIYVENIRRALALLSPQNAAYFNVRAKTYSEKITALDKSLREAVLSIAPEKRYLVTCEGAFSYLAKDYGLQEIYLWAINDESQGSPQQVAAVVDAVERYDIPVVFCESTIEPRIQEEVARASGARLGGLLYVDSLSSASGPAPTYLALLEHTVSTIVSGLTTNN
ncbi:MAG: Periplasmic solute binding protein [Parcubacteria group bacterium GW2011_GWA2_51_10]|nr:MAG: Periplasmic solute binding protein [Parcubacteria group bacterium GW2011_GWA2_51_10]